MVIKSISHDPSLSRRKSQGYSPIAVRGLLKHESLTHFARSRLTQRLGMGTNPMCKPRTHQQTLNNDFWLHCQMDRGCEFWAKVDEPFNCARGCDCTCPEAKDDVNACDNEKPLLPIPTDESVKKGEERQRHQKSTQNLCREKPNHHVSPKFRLILRSHESRHDCFFADVKRFRQQLIGNCTDNEICDCVGYDNFEGKICEFPLNHFCHLNCKMPLLPFCESRGYLHFHSLVRYKFAISLWLLRLGLSLSWCFFCVRWFDHELFWCWPFRFRLASNHPPNESASNDDDSQNDDNCNAQWNLSSHDHPPFHALIQWQQCQNSRESTPNRLSLK